MPIPAESCSRESVAVLVRAFIRAYTVGDSENLDQMWAPEPDFEWYAVSPDELVRDDADDRESLLPYFHERYQLNDRLHLKYLRVSPEDDRGHFGIAYRLHRQSD